MPTVLPEPTLRRMKVADILPWDGNPREHSDEQLAMLEKSLDAFGLGALPIVQAGTSKLIAGHGRLMALKRRGIEEIPVLEMAVTDEQALAYAIADNRLQDLSSWNISALKAAIAEIDTGAVDLESIGFTALAIEEMFGGGAFGRTNENHDPDDAPALPVEPVTHPGDLWVMGKHRVLCGDSTSASDMARLMDGQKAMMVLTDPPYGVDYHSESKALKDAGTSSIANDTLNGDDFRKFLIQVFAVMNAACAHKAAFYIFYASRFHREFEDSMNLAKLEVRAQIIWVKTQASFGFSQYKWMHEPIMVGSRPDEIPLMFADQHETVFYAFKNGQSPFWKGDRSQTTVWQCSRERNYQHPTQKPVELLHRAVLNSSVPGSIVLDPFGGSGSTTITCELLDRACYSMELDPRFVDVVVKRWEDLTGQKAVLAPRVE